MRTFTIKTARRSTCVVVCKENAFEAELAPLAQVMQGRGGIVFTDSNVAMLYREKMDRYLAGIPRFIMPAGEAYKTRETLFTLLERMAEAGLRRNSVLVALGGGVVGDLGGLAASLYMRGIPYVQVPTTLLAQVDSSVGGKTAIDFCGVKNLVGAFYPSERVVADPAFFRTLPPREIRCGLGEIVKHGALCPELFEQLWENRENLTDLRFLARIVPENIDFKASVVRRDPHETGLRKCLNLGHTTAHALELTFRGLSHGECVLMGLLFESSFARRHTACDEAFQDRLGTLVKTVLPEIPKTDFRGAARLALLDKKNGEEGTVTMTVPVAAGKFELLQLPFETFSEEFSKIGEELCCG